MTIGDILKLIVLGAVVLALPIGGCMYGYPQYSVYEQRLQGEAELAKATYSKQAKVQEALAAKDSAEYLAEAEITRAKGVAAANKIVADGLGGPEGYLRYLYIQSLQDTKNQVIYLPTEAGLPVLEANRLKR